MFVGGRSLVALRFGIGFLGIIMGAARQDEETAKASEDAEQEAQVLQHRPSVEELVQPAPAEDSPRRQRWRARTLLMQIALRA